jgi:hypothetical protein
LVVLDVAADPVFVMLLLEFLVFVILVLLW